MKKVGKLNSDGFVTYTLDWPYSKADSGYIILGIDEDPYSFYVKDGVKIPITKEQEARYKSKPAFDATWDFSMMDWIVPPPSPDVPSPVTGL